MKIDLIRNRLLASTVIAGSLIAAPAFAQDNSPGNSPNAATQTPGGMQTSQSAPAVAPDSSGEIVVTGTLIKNPNLVSAAPVTVIGQEEIQLRQSNTAEEILRDLPGAVPNIGSAVNNGNGGASFVDLRGLGPQRNLVLLDGQRITPAGLSGIVDLNNIPLALIERVDTLTGGAATTYGADAVAGVVNFITRSDFSGVEVNSSEQITQKGDGNYFRTDVTVGANFDDGRGNAVFSIGYQRAAPVYQGDRGFSNTAIDSFSGVVSGSGTTIPGRFSGTRPLTAAGQPNTMPAYVTGAFTIDPVTGARVPVRNAAGADNGGVRQVNAAGQAVGTFALFNFNPYNIFQTPFRRYNMYGAGHYEVADGVEIYTRGLFSKNTVSTIIAPSGVFNSAITVNLNNPYLPASLRNQFCAFNVAPVNPLTSVQDTYVPRFTPAQCAAAAVATGPTDPNYRTVTTNVARRTTEVGPRLSDFTTQVFDYKAGIKVDITSAIDLDVSGSYGESENTQALQGYVLTSRVRQAALANNTTTCIDPSNGCVPINLFGPAGSITPNQVPFLTAASTTRVQTSLAQARALLKGDFGVTSPFASDPIGFAVGSEYRKYTAQQRSDTLAKTAGELGGAGGAAPDITGGYEVYEGYGELIAPIVADKPGIRSLTLEAGARYSHYKVNAAGSPTFSTTTYKGAATYEPVEGIKLRANYQHAVRAPNINELFSPVNTVLTNLAVDPCAGAAPTTNANLRAVCIAQGAPAATIGSILNPTAGQANITTGGNPLVKPEKSNSYTGGIVLQPRNLVPGFTLTVDYYHIKITHEISSFTPGDLVTGCFGAITAASASSPACLAFARNPTTGGLDGDPATTRGLITNLGNLGTALTDGIDLGANYRRDLGFAKLNLSFQGNWTHRSRFQATPISLNRDCVGYYSVNCLSIQPKFSWSQRTTFTFGSVDLSLLWRHLSHERQEPDDVVNGNGPAYTGTFNGKQVNFGRIKAFNYFDSAIRLGAGDHLDFTFTVENLLDKKPPFVGYDIGSTAFNSGNTYPSTYDALGRRFAVGARLKF